MGPPREFSLGGRGSWNTKVQVFVYKNSQINISFCKISFFPTMKSGSEAGGGGVPPPPRVTCELSRVCWLKQRQHNMQHVQITRGGKACQEAKNGPRPFAKDL